MADSNGNGTPLLDELQKGPWPSFVTEIKSMADDNKMCRGLLGQLEKSYRDRQGYWKHGGIVGVMGYGGGVIGRRHWSLSSLGWFPPVVPLSRFGFWRIQTQASWP